MIRIVDVCHKYGETVVLDNLSLELPDSGLITVMGESGTGKTTFLRILSGILTPTSGTVLGLSDRIISIAFQEPRLLEWRTAIENVALVSNREIAMNILCSLSMEENLNKRASELSGGQKQRVSLARAFAFGTDVVLLDEPFSGLDAKNRVLVANWIHKCRLAIVVTHDPSDLILLHPDKKINL